MKYLIILGLLLTNIFGNILLYEGLYLNQKIENIDLKDYKKINPEIYKLGNGIVYEKEDLYEDKSVKKVLKFNKNNELELVFFINNSKDLNIEDLVNEPKNKEVKFLGGTLAINGNNKIYSLEEKENLKKDLSEKLIDLTSFANNTILTTSKFIIKNENLNNEVEVDNYTGMSKLKSCISEEHHKDCVKCEYIEGQDKTINCSNLYIYHPIIK
jgi:hypothetical protein